MTPGSDHELWSRRAMELEAEGLDRVMLHELGFRAQYIRELAHFYALGAEYVTPLMFDSCTGVPAASLARCMITKYETLIEEGLEKWRTMR